MKRVRRLARRAYHGLYDRLIPRYRTRIVNDLLPKQLVTVRSQRSFVNIRRSWLRWRSLRTGYSQTRKQENRIGQVEFRRTGLSLLQKKRG